MRLRKGYLPKAKSGFSFGMEGKPETAPRLFWAGAICFIALIAAFVNFTVMPPRDFVENSIFTIKKGQTVSEIADELEDGGFIRSKAVFKFLVHTVFAGDRGANTGDYVFEKPLSAFAIAHRIVSADFRLKPIRITIPEGLNKFEMADVIGTRLPHFDEEKFIALAPEGYLFPDTYFFTPRVTPEEVIIAMRENFDVKIKEQEEAIKNFGRPLEEIITMASIVETEARKFETRKTIAGILWKRIDEKMPLQVDVTFKYVNGETTFDLSLDDLAIDSPYNTYKYAGLPPTPIANPGMSSIIATISPGQNNYYFFLSDRQGNMHYASTFEEHKLNKQLYLQ